MTDKQPCNLAISPQKVLFRVMERLKQFFHWYVILISQDFSPKSDDTAIVYMMTVKMTTIV